MIVIKPGMLHGSVNAQPSKSVAHRAVIAAALCKGHSVIDNIELSNDISATINCICALGARCQLADRRLYVDGINSGGEAVFDCGESGSTLRFIIPVAMSRGEKYEFKGSSGLLDRPLDPYGHFFSISRNACGLIIKGRLKPGVFKLPGDISSQFVTGLMLALPLLENDSVIVMSTPLQSKPYVDLTLRVLERFGIDIRNDGYYKFFVAGNQLYKPCMFAVEGDYSQAAFWLVANALGSELGCVGLDPDSAQGDKAIIDIINSNDRVISVRDIPDLAPILAVLCCFRDGESKIINGGRLRYKESDRLRTITTELNRIGADITELDDGLIIRGVNTLRGGEVYAHNDHRLAMALAIAATRCESEVIIHGHECVAKSYPMFFSDFLALRNNWGKPL